MGGGWEFIREVHLISWGGGGELPPLVHLGWVWLKDNRNPENFNWRERPHKIGIAITILFHTAMQKYGELH